ncbi:glycerol kinase, putative [Babesia bigemina]|uniref:glycerol kinase n=1 Tax=Babesia bigemina TaxID=5866 RepID=A0A061DAJ1_BABBI|nr:glycerol kinase, putative [Babesia bigemina]CDR97711.1 glycerol kinase, putative [Babesia bigemina]|eukprot:XP_012769897.1 glycerol kinase, putative [Babesia bigemina]
METAVKVVAAIDQGTQSTRCMFFDEALNVLAISTKKHKQYYPKSGWCEHDPLEIMESVYSTMNEALSKVVADHGNVEIMGVGITNQRETVVAWEAQTGKPLHNAIVWLDIRAEDIAHDLIREHGSATAFMEKTGLIINSYFSAVKLMWMSKHLPWFNNAVENKSVRFGTIDTWIIYRNITTIQQNLTGEYVTDVTNASRTMLMDIVKEKWSSQMLRIFRLNVDVLPKILPNCAEFGVITNPNVPGFVNVRLTSSIGDQQAACVGQGILEPCATKCTLGTGGFVLTNTGTKRVKSSGGLLCTPCYKLGKEAQTVFALEGSIAIVGAGISWLKAMGIIEAESDISGVLKECKTSGGVVFVPAFSGLLAPRWRGDARACIMGMTQHTERAHIIRAFCESIGLQLGEILQSLLTDMGVDKVPYICVDGGISTNEEILQLISDIVDTSIELFNAEKSAVAEATCAGAAILAGVQAKLWNNVQDIQQFIRERPKKWMPRMSDSERDILIKYWNLGVERSMNWNQ